jgi:hypothetical protein
VGTIDGFPKEFLGERLQLVIARYDPKGVDGFPQEFLE